MLCDCEVMSFDELVGDCIDLFQRGHQDITGAGGEGRHHLGCFLQNLGHFLKCSGVVIHQLNAGCKLVVPNCCHPIPNHFAEKRDLVRQCPPRGLNLNSNSFDDACEIESFSECPAWQ